MKRDRWFLILAVAVASVLACTTAQSQTVKEVPREKTAIFENIEGRVAIPNNMNPYIAGQYLDWGVWQGVYESLFIFNLETGQLMPWLAESGEYNADATEVTIRLREGVTWADGVPFTADDVVFTIDMLKKNAGLQYAADVTEWVDTATVSDPRTIVIKLKKPNPRFLLNFFGVRIWDTLLIAPKHIWEKVDPMTFTNFDLEKGLPLGTGPYRMVRSSETETVFDRRDDWWGAKTGFHPPPEPERLIWIAVGGEDIRAAKLANNELDAAWVLSRSSFEVAKKKNPKVIGWYEELPYAYLDPCPRELFFNTEAAPFNDPNVRRAISSAINREQIAQIGYEGMTEPAESMFPTYAPLKAYLDRNKKLFEEFPVAHHDLKKTEELMTAAGFKKDAEGMWVGTDGKRVSLPIISRSGETDQLKFGPILVAQLKKAGFDASFKPIEDVTYYSDVSSGKAPANLGSVCGSVQDPYTTFSYLHGRWYAPTGQPVPGPVATRFRNAEFDALIDKMAGLSADDPSFNQLADQALAIFNRELPVLPLVQARLLTPFNETYWTGWPNAKNNYVHPGHWWVSGNLIILELKPAKAQ
jgi:peptide/nickel transport system substrate-binding protein